MKSPTARIDTRRSRSTGDEEIENGCNSFRCCSSSGTRKKTKVPGSYIMRRSTGRITRSMMALPFEATAARR